MGAQTGFRKDMLKILCYALLSLFLVPGITLAFSSYASGSLDSDALASFSRRIEADTTLSPEARTAKLDFVGRHLPSSACFSTDPQVSLYRDRVCESLSPLWQFSLAKRLSLGTLLTGLVTLLATVALGGFAFTSRAAQLTSLVAGWRLLTVVMAAEIIAQGVMVVWLAFWLTAFFMHIYFIKLLAIAGVMAGVAVFATVAGILRRPVMDNSIQGELVDQASSPRLWQHVQALAERIGTAPPDQIVAGIDANFFVTEAPLTIGQRSLSGRTLFVSVPLLRLLERGEADAVLAHELAHLQGGDTASSAALGPKLAQYDQYCRMMNAKGLTMVVHYVMLMYRLILEFAMKGSSREREFLADRTAAGIVSPQAIVHSLVKVAAYSSYRSQVEQKLFQQREQHRESLGIADNIASGLAPYAASTHFVDAMKTAKVPHPFDSHPALHERMANVGFALDESGFRQLVTQSPEDNWSVDIGNAAAIEQRLWQIYEQQFAAMHEQKLAYLFRPSNDEERAIVLKYFPPVTIPLKKGQQVVISHEGLTLPGKQDTIPWDSVSKLNYKDGYGGDKLEVTHPEKGFLGARTTKVTLRGIKPHRKAFKATLGRYWQRHQIMRREEGKVH